MHDFQYSMPRFVLLKYTQHPDILSHSFSLAYFRNHHVRAELIRKDLSKYLYMFILRVLSMLVQNAPPLDQLLMRHRYQSATTIANQYFRVNITYMEHG